METRPGPPQRNGQSDNAHTLGTAFRGRNHGLPGTTNAATSTGAFALDGVFVGCCRRLRSAPTWRDFFVRCRLRIAVDRIVENVLWIVLVDLDFVPVWVAIVFITRSFTVDYIRSYGASQGTAPFDMAKRPISRFLVAGAFMRTLYAFIKWAVFSWILLIQPWEQLFPAFWASWSATFQAITDTLIYTALALCLIRGLPVIVEFTLWQGTSFKHADTKQT